MALLILRAVFVVMAAAVGASLATQYRDIPWQVFSSVMLLAFGVLFTDVSARTKRLDVISSVYFGVIVGLFFTYVAGLAISPLLPDNDPRLRGSIQIVLGLVLVYLCTSLLLQTREDFRFIIPFVEFAREIKGLKPYVLDTSVIIDGRIAELAESQLFDRHLVMPQFVLLELQQIADSSDRQKRSRGRRGLETLERLRKSAAVELEVFDRELPQFSDQPVDMKLVLLAKHLDGKLVTSDSALDQVARVQGVEVINLNKLAASLRPPYLPGEELPVFIQRPGEEPTQGIGYLDDGTMVVVDGGRSSLHKWVTTSVTNTLHTANGRMIFGRYLKDAQPPGPNSASAGR